MIFVRDAIPREIDPLSSLGVDGGGMAQRCSTQLLADHPDLQNLDGDEIAGDVVRLIESLAVTLDVNSDGPFVEHVKWLAAVYHAREIPAHLLEDLLLTLRQCINEQQEDAAAQVVKEKIGYAIEILQEEPAREFAEAGETLMALTTDRLVSALLRGDRDRALEVMETGIKSGLKVLDCYVGVIQPSMRKIGLMWQGGEITVSQEHVASALVPSVMARCRTHFRGRLPRHGLLVLTGVPGELHEIGLQVLADAAEADGWNVRNIGTNAPISDTVGYLMGRAPSVIGVSVTMSFNLAAATDLVRAIRSEAPLRRSTVFVGGLAAHFNADAWDSLGVICAERMDAGTFVSLAREKRL